MNTIELSGEQVGKQDLLTLVKSFTGNSRKQRADWFNEYIQHMSIEELKEFYQKYNQHKFNNK